MGILANSVSIVQFEVSGTLPSKELDHWVQQGLTDNRFHSIDDGVEEESIGWVAFDDNLGADFTNPFTFRRDHFVIATLRKDVRKVPTFLLRRQFSRECEQWLTNHPGMERVPNQARLEIRDRLRFELLSRSLPTPATIDLVWDTDKKVVTAGTTSAKGVELVREHFEASFPGLSLTLIHPIARAHRVLDEQYHSALEAANEAQDKDVVTQIKQNAWVGQEFLLWLLYRTRKTGSEYTISQNGPADIDDGFVSYINDRIVLTAEDEGGVQKSAFSGPLRDFAEARKAAQKGKKIAEAMVHFEKNELAWKLTLKGENFAFSSYKCPPVQIERDEITDPNAEREAVFFERMHLLDTGLQMFDSVFSHFLIERFGGQWNKTLQGIRKLLDE